MATSIKVSLACTFRSYDTFVRVIALDAARFLHDLHTLRIHNGSGRIWIPSDASPLGLPQRAR
jgi:hypothetical protein